MFEIDFFKNLPEDIARMIVAILAADFREEFKAKFASHGGEGVDPKAFRMVRICELCGEYFTKERHHWWEDIELPYGSGGEPVVLCRDFCEDCNSKFKDRRYCDCSVVVPITAIDAEDEHICRECGTIYSTCMVCGLFENWYDRNACEYGDFR